MQGQLDGHDIILLETVKIPVNVLDNSLSGQQIWTGTPTSWSSAIVIVYYKATAANLAYLKSGDGSLFSVMDGSSGCWYWLLSPDLYFSTKKLYLSQILWNVSHIADKNKMPLLCMTIVFLQVIRLSEIIFTCVTLIPYFNSGLLVHVSSNYFQ